MLALQITWERYVSAWKAASAAEKRALYEGCLHPACLYRDPLHEAKGWDALTSYMLDFDTQIPGGHFVTTSFMAHHQRSLASWQMAKASRSAKARVMANMMSTVS